MGELATTRHYLSLLEDVISKSDLLSYFKGFTVAFLPREAQNADDADNSYYIGHDNPAAALLLPGFFHKQLGLEIGNNIIEKSRDEQDCTFGVEIPETLLHMNLSSLHYISSHMAEHILALRQLWGCYGVLNIHLRSDILEITCTKETHDMLLRLRGAANITPSLGSIIPLQEKHHFYGVALPVTTLQSDKEMLTRICTSVRDLQQEKRQELTEEVA